MSDRGRNAEPEVRSVGPVIHGVECYEAWRRSEDCPHESAERHPDGGAA
jgi:hypothetical protein